MNPNPQTEIIRLISESLKIQELFQQFPTTTELLEASEQQLTIIKGIGIGKARQITALLQLAKSLTLPTPDRVAIQCPKDVYDLLAPELRHSPKEQFTCLFLNTKNRVIFKEIISVGSLNAAIVHPREVFRAAIKRCSASLICVHNHPSFAE
ncbi:JAB domain-containing protein [Paenibacillus humicus]|uniref:JAB domain-containing protein n=1 Tax=Paenibacillus humicus TaxID=412861 RepID=UPI000FDB8FBA|nr:JAB domain-containing protein [Paenibacillus humicus]